MQATDIYRHQARFDSALRRLVDIVAASIGLLVALPLFLAIGIAIEIQDGGSMFYRATRVGKDGKLFRLYKFRTMIVNADQQGPAVTTQGDARVTAIGRWLRRTKLDELPQLLNVLVGDMSLVGPRPEDPRYVARYTPAQQQVLRVRPGITGPASIEYRHEEQLLNGSDWESTYLLYIMPVKLALDLDYLLQRTVWSDIALIFRTILALVR